MLIRVMAGLMISAGLTVCQPGWGWMVETARNPRRTITLACSAVTAIDCGRL
jgi:hypothetical protein